MRATASGSSVFVALTLLSHLLAVTSAATILPAWVATGVTYGVNDSPVSAIA